MRDYQILDTSLIPHLSAHRKNVYFYDVLFYGFVIGKGLEGVKGIVPIVKSSCLLPHN